MVAYNNSVLVYGGFATVKAEKPQAKSSQQQKNKNVEPEEDRGMEMADLWCLDVQTWKWSQVKLSGFQVSSAKALCKRTTKQN